MADTTTTSSDAAADRAAEQARLRKQRREAKIKAGGTSRLDKITGIGGRVVGDHATETAKPAQAAAAATPTATATGHGDPDEVDISEHFYKPATTNRIPSDLAPVGEPNLSDAQLRQMMLGMTPPTSNTPPGANVPVDEDPLMKMMAQMMGGGQPGAEGAENPFANMMGGGMPQMQQQQAPQGPDVYTTFWRLLHALVALGLGLYIASVTPFSGSKAQREASKVVMAEGAELAEAERHRNNFFWAFATAEAVLLTTRFFLDKGRAPPPGIAWKVAGFLPEPFKGYVSTVLRYGQIFTTVRTDILGCVFVLGICSLLRA